MKTNASLCQTLYLAMAISSMSCGSSTSPSASDTPPSAYGLEYWASRLPSEVQVTDLDVHALWANGPLPTATLEQNDTSMPCETMAMRNIEKIKFTISQEENSSQFASLINTKDAKGFIHCAEQFGTIQKAQAGANFSLSYEITHLRMPLILSQLSDTLILIATPEWHYKILTGTREETNLPSSSQLPRSGQQDPIADEQSVLPAPELAATLFPSCQAKSAADAYLIADSNMNDADGKLCAYIALPPPIGTPACAMATNLVSRAASVLYDARDALSACPASCLGGVLAFPPAGVSAVMKNLYDYMSDVCSTYYLPLHNVIAGPILLSRLRADRIWTQTPASMAWTLASCPSS